MAARALPVFTHAACFGHDPGPGHVEVPARLGAVVTALRDLGPDIEWLEAPRATRGQLLRVHEPLLLHTILESGDGHVQLDPDTVLSPGSAEAALRAAGAVVAAVDLVMGGEAEAAFCAVRPPGHHATTSHAMGFCLFNNVAIGAAHALDRHGLARVAVVDFDVHHGNGTQAIFAGDIRVLYASAHEMPLFPESGDPRERSVGPNIHNAALQAGSGSRRFREAWGERLLPAIEGFEPQLLLLSAGFDGHRADPVAHVELEAGDFAWLTTELAAIAGRHAGGRVVSVLEGGYDLGALAECSVAHVHALAAGSPA